MHSAVLQNKKYVKFADKNTVEVLALGRLDEAVQKKDRKAATYKKKGPDGKVVEYMVAWPSLTYDEIIKLSRSKAGSFNKSGGIPYTSIVDPWTEKEIEGFNGGSSKSIQEKVKNARKALVKAHGKGISRKQIRKIDKAIASAAAMSRKGDFGKAMAKLKKVDPGEQGPELLQEKVSTAREDVLAAAKKELSAAETLLGEDAKKGKRALQKLARRLRGTGLEDQVKNLLKASGDN